MKIATIAVAAATLFSVSASVEAQTQSPAAQQNLAYCDAIGRQFGLDPNFKEMEVCRQRAIIAAQQGQVYSNALPAAPAMTAPHEQAARSAATSDALLDASKFFMEMGRPYQLPNSGIHCPYGGGYMQCN